LSFFKTKPVYNIDEALRGKSMFTFTNIVVGEEDFVYDCSVTDISEEEVANYIWPG
jgi:hypothetical protein